MRVLVTRPEPAAQATAARLAALGHEPVLLPLARAVHDREAALAALEAPGDLIVTSAEVFRVLGAVPEAVTSRRVFCVGPATAEAAKRAGFADIVTAEGTGLSLAARIAAGPPRAPLLYLAGEPRSPDLEAKLAEAHIPLTVTTCYRMQPLRPDAPALAAAFADPPDAVLLYSRESARHFFALPNLAADRFGTTRFLCISEKTASAVPAAFAAHVAVAAAPDEAALFALLALPSSQN